MTTDNNKSPAYLQPEAKGIFLIIASLLFFLSLFTFVDGDPSQNWLGLVGHFLALGSQCSLGMTSYLIAASLMIIGRDYLVTKSSSPFLKKWPFLLILFAAFSFLLTVIADNGGTLTALNKHTFSSFSMPKSDSPIQMIRYYLGGVPAYYLYKDLPVVNLKTLLSPFGVVVTASLFSFASLIIILDVDLYKLFLKVGHGTKHAFETSVKWAKQQLVALGKMSKNNEKESESRALVPVDKTVPDLPKPQTSETKEAIEELELEDMDTSRDDIMIHKDERKLPKLKEKFNQKNRSIFKKAYTLPPLTLLSNAKAVDKPSLNKKLKEQALVLEETLLSFGIEAKVGEIHCGPTITSFEVHPAVGVKVQKIKALEDDIALNLQAKSIRIIAPIPGKAVVGVEIPSPYAQEVGFKEMLYHYHRRDKLLTIPVLLGKTVSGEDVFTDLTKMPHCIIAGATGSGKSVCINTIIMSMLMTTSPDDLNLLLVDPKKVELTPFSKLPHLIAPVITEAHGAYAALNWLVKEMQYRYELLKQTRMRNITAFNKRTPDREHEESLRIEVPEKLTYIVAIIDEFADLMMTSSSDLETPIARIAQMARAVGIHLILATQRPSREVITGLIKANFPTRISFKVASRVNSQIILDDTGAESLLGNGDMLFLPPGTSNLLRAQGSYIRDEDIHRVVDYITSQRHAEYKIKSFDQMGSELQKEDDEAPKDALYEKAYEVVISTGNASTTFLQRKLKVGYARAASLIDELEERGIVSPAEGSKPRKVLQNEDSFPI